MWERPDVILMLERFEEGLIGSHAQATDACAARKCW